MEAIVTPMTWDQWPEGARGIFESMRSDAGEEMILTKNLFVEAILPASIIRKLSDEEMAEYRRPFAERGEGRRPTLTWPRQIPLSGEPADVVEIVQSYADWLSTSEIPKLFINADPGDHPDRPPARFLSDVAEPDRNDRYRNPLHPRGQPRRNRRSYRRLARQPITGGGANGAGSANRLTTLVVMVAMSLSKPLRANAPNHEIEPTEKDCATLWGFIEDDVRAHIGGPVSGTRQNPRTPPWCEPCRDRTRLPTPERRRVRVSRAWCP